MADVLQQPGLLSAFAIAIEQDATPVLTPGTYTPPTTLIDAESFQITDDPAIIEFEVMRRSRNITQNTRAGIHKVMANLTAPFYSLQGGPLWRALIGTDIMSGATAVAFPALAGTTYAVGNQTWTLAASPAVPTPPAGIGSWVGLWIDIGTGATKDRLMVLGLSGVTLLTSASANTHASADVANVPVQHVIQETIAPNKHILPTVSATAQFAELLEWQVAFGFVQKGGLKGDSKTIKVDWSLAFSTIPNDPGSLSTLSQSQAEADDSPFIMRDGGLVTPYATTDPVGRMHSRVVSLDYELDNGLIAREYGGGVQLAEFYVPGARKHSIKFKEDAGQYAASPALHTNYVKTQKSLPAFLAFHNPENDAAFGLYFPNCKVKTYNPVTVMNEPVAYDGELLPLEDGTTGISVRCSICNGTTVAY